MFLSGSSPVTQAGSPSMRIFPESDIASIGGYEWVRVAWTRKLIGRY